MKQEITYNKKTDTFHVAIEIPKTQKGTHTYGEGEWKAPAVCVWIDEKMQEFAFSHTQYLDYKDSLQATQPIVFFDSQEEAEKFAEEHGLMVEYSR